jgi:hypothetical protein
MRWCSNFLYDTYLMVKVNSTLTIKFKIEAGVPQGAVRSPIVFSIFIYDIPCNIIRNFCYSLLFVDDLVTYFIFKQAKLVEKCINKYLKRPESWLSEWRMVMAPNRCNYTIFFHSKKDGKLELNIILNKEKLLKNVKPSFLGIRIDPALNFNNQVEYLFETCHIRLKCIKILSQKSYKLEHKTLVQIYFSLIRSVMESSAIIFPGLTEQRYKRLQAIQNSALRSIFGIQFKTSTSEIQKITGVQLLSDRVTELHLWSTKTNNPSLQFYSFLLKVYLHYVSKFLQFNNFIFYSEETISILFFKLKKKVSILQFNSI